MALSAKGFGGRPFLIICSFNRWIVSMALHIVQVTTIFCRAVVTTSEASSRLGVFQVFHPFHCMTCFVLLVMGSGLKFCVFSPLRAPHCVFCIFECDLLFGPGSFLLLVLFPCREFFLPSFLPLFIY
jgi:hypothetical protein